MSFAGLRRQYARSRRLVSSEEPYANLDWILGARRDIARGPLHLETKMVELSALWLEDLAAEVDRFTAATFSHGTRGSAAQGLRDAVKRFVLAFGISPANPVTPTSRCKWPTGMRVPR